MKRIDSENFSPRDVEFEIYDENAELVMSGRFEEDNEHGERSTIMSGVGYNIYLGEKYHSMGEDLSKGRLASWMFETSTVPLDSDNISFCVRSDFVAKSVKSNWGYTFDDFKHEIPPVGAPLSPIAKLFSEYVPMTSGLLAIDGMRYPPERPAEVVQEERNRHEKVIAARFDEVLAGESVPAWVASETYESLHDPRDTDRDGIELAVSSMLRKLMLDIGRDADMPKQDPNSSLNTDSLHIVAKSIKETFCGLDVSEWVWHESISRCSPGAEILPKDALAATLSGLMARADLKRKDDLLYSKLKMLENDERAELPLSSDLSSESSRYYAKKLIDLDIKNELHKLLDGYLGGEIKPDPYDRLKFNTLNEAAITMGKAFGFEIDEEVLKEELLKSSDIKMYLNLESKRTDPALRAGDKDKGVFQFPKSLSTIGERVFLKMADRNVLFASREAFVELIQAATDELKSYAAHAEVKLFGQADADNSISTSIRR